MFDDFDLCGDPGAFGGPHEPSGCVWHVVFICVVTMLFIGFLRWMS